MNDPDYWHHYPASIAQAAALAQAMGLQTSVYTLGSPDDPTVPAAAILKMPPNHVLARHAHTCDRVEVIIAGSIEADGRTLGPGDVMTATEGEFYGDHVAGPSGCTTVEIFSTLSGVHNTLFPDGDGGVLRIDLCSAEAAALLAADTST